MKTIEQLNKVYAALLSGQHFIKSDLDYTILEQHKIILQKLSQVGNSGITIFDLFKRVHVFSSFNLHPLFGYDLNEIEKGGNAYFNSRIHPEDYIVLIQNGINLLKFIFSLPFPERMDYKLINEYRILNRQGAYVRIVEQQQAMEVDRNGNVWLALSVIDISPYQENFQGVKCQILNYKTGTLVHSELQYLQASGAFGLTKREKEVLGLVHEGLLSKEISDQLFISINTVNTHRQRILEKLGVDNSLEAVKFALQLGLLQ